jgi:hypothetical protein
MYSGSPVAERNTMMSLSAPGELVEVDKAGKIVRSIGGLGKDIRMGWTSGFAVLPDGVLRR